MHLKQQKNKKSKNNVSPLNPQKMFYNAIAYDKENISDEIFKAYFRYQNLSSFLAKYLLIVDTAKNKEIVNRFNEKLIDLRTHIHKK